MVYVAQQQLDRYDATVRHALKHKAVFDKQVLEHKPGEVIFRQGQLIQFYCSSLDYTFDAKHKLVPKWSSPHHITTCLCNSYKIETINGDAVPGEFHARRLRRFIPRDGTKLAEEQEKIEEELTKRMGSTEDNLREEENKRIDEEDDEDDPNQGENRDQEEKGGERQEEKEREAEIAEEGEMERAAL